MKIAVYFNLPSGGAKRALYEQVKILVTRHQVDIYTLDTANHDFADLRSIVKNYYIYKVYKPKFMRFAKFLTSFEMTLAIYFSLPKLHQKIATDMSKKNYDVAFLCHDLFTQSPYLFRYLDIPSIYFCQEPKREFYEHIPRVTKKFTYRATLPLRLPLKNIDRRNISYASLILVNSKYSKSLIERIYRVKASVNYLGVDTEKFQPMNLKRENFVLSVGGFNLLKGHDFVIKSIAPIPKRWRPKFVIVGNGGEDELYLRRLARNNDVDLEMHQDISDEKLLHWYNKARIFAYAPHNEPLGLAPLEAVASGLPVVAINEGGVREILQNISSCRLINRNASQMSRIITQMIHDKYNYSKIEKDIDFIRKRYNWDKSVNQLEKYLKSVLFHSPRGSPFGHPRGGQLQ